MLRSLHVKNLALIEEQEVQFGKGLNILTGDHYWFGQSCTGGKSAKGNAARKCRFGTGGTDL